MDQMEEKTCLRMSPKDCTEGYTQEGGFGFRVTERWPTRKWFCLGSALRSKATKRPGRPVENNGAEASGRSCVDCLGYAFRRSLEDAPIVST